MIICSNCLEVITALTTFLGGKRGWEIAEPAWLLCCDWPNIIEVEDGELTDYEEAYNETGIDLDDLTEKEQVILRYLAKEGRIEYAYTEIYEVESTDSMVRDKQLGLDLF